MSTNHNANSPCPHNLARLAQHQTRLDMHVGVVRESQRDVFIRTSHRPGAMGPARLSSSVSPARRRTSPSFSERAQANPHKRCASLSPATRSAPSRRSNPLPTVTTANNGPNRPGISTCAVTETKADAECSAGGDVVGEHVPKGSLGRARPTPLDTRMSENECPSQNAVRSDCLQARGEVFLDTSLRGNKCRGGSGKDVDRDGDEEGQGGAVAPVL